jgi:hypothetical protein
MAFQTEPGSDVELVEVPIIDIQALVEVDLWNGWVWVFI